jgi:hypothetical protein
LRKYNDQREEIASVIRKNTIDSVMSQIRREWLSESHPVSLSSVKAGVYVISIIEGFGVKYGRGICSEVMYIGRGAIANRLRSHLHNWIFDMSISLRDVPFKFYMQSFPDGRTPDLFKHFEGHLLKEFESKFHEKPLINKIHGRRGVKDYDYTGNWDKPLDNRGKEYLWEIRPTAKNDWFKELEDE